MKRSYKNLVENFSQKAFIPYRYEDRNQASTIKIKLNEAAPVLATSSHPNGYVFEDILKLIENQPKGQWFNLECRTDANNTTGPFHISRTGKGHEVYKITTMQIRIGIKYRNQKIVQDLAKKKIINLTGSFAWAKWKPGYEGLFVTHKTADTGDYLMCFLGANKAINQYFVDGKEVTKQELFDTGYIRPSYFNNNKPTPLAMTPKISNIIGMSIDAKVDDDDVDPFALAGEDYFTIEESMTEEEKLIDEAVEDAADLEFDKQFVEEISHYRFLSPEETEAYISSL